MPQNPWTIPTDFLLTPVHSLLESAQGIGENVPLVGPAFGAPANFLLENLDWSGVEGFRDEHPIAAGVAELLSFLIPGGAYAKVGQGLGALPGLTRAAARLGGRSAPMRFALGESARWAPFTAGLTAFDAAAGRYESPGDAISSFLAGTALGGAASLAGASPAVSRALQRIPVAGRPLAAGVRFLGPTQPQRALYGLGDEVAQDPAIRDLSPLFREGERAQEWGKVAQQALEEIEAGTRPREQQNTLFELMDKLRPEIFGEVLPRTENYVRFGTPATEGSSRRSLNAEFTPGKSVASGQRQGLTQLSMDTPNDWRRIQNELQLPQGWEWAGRFFRHRTAGTIEETRQLRSRFGLQPGTANPHGFRRIAREVRGPDGPYSQTWSVLQEDDGMWLVATELPRHRYQNRFFYFKTPEPEKFFSDMNWARNIDNPWDFRGMTQNLGMRAWETTELLPKGVSKVLDEALGLKETILSPANFKAFRDAAARGNPGAVSALAAKLGERGTPGLNLAGILDYLKPTQFDFRNSPSAAFVWRFSQALYDRLEGEAQALLFGKRDLKPNHSVWQMLFGKPEGPDDSVMAATQRLFKDQDVRDEFQKYHHHQNLPNDQWPEGAAKEYHAILERTFMAFAKDLNKTLEAIGERPIPLTPGSIGMGFSHSALGSNFYKVLDYQGNIVGLGVGHSAATARRRAQEIIGRQAERGDPGKYRIGDHFAAENYKAFPRDVKLAMRTPGWGGGAGVMGFKYDLEKIDSTDDWVADLVHGYISRSRDVANRLSKLMTAKEYDFVMRHDPKAGSMLENRLKQLRGEQLPAAKIQNQMLDRIFGDVFGVNSATKIAEAFNAGVYHLSLGAGNLGHAVVNTLGPWQTGLSELSNLRTSSLEDLIQQGYIFSMPDSMGRPSGFLAAAVDPLSSMKGALRVIKSDNPRHREAWQRMADTYKLGPRFVEEFTGESNRFLARSLTDGVTEADDIGKWITGLSSFLPANTEKLARMWSGGAAMHMLDSIERSRGFKMSDEAYFQNVATFIDRTNAQFAAPGRELIFTSPLGSVFGGMKHWMMNYLWLLADYTDLAVRKGNFAPILTALGSTAGLGGLFALPFAPTVLDWATETFGNKDLMETLYSSMGEGPANAVAFGLPTLAGLSLSGATAAPGSNLAHDAEFMFSVIALERMKNMARSVGRYFDQQSIGVDPWQDPVFVQQFAQGWGPRSLYRALDVFSDAALNSARSGNPMIDLGARSPVDQFALALGFTPVEIEREYAIYDRLLSDRGERDRMIGLFGEAFMRAQLQQDQVAMEEVLRTAAIRGLDPSAILRSAATRARNLGTDMFGRNMPEDVLGRYQAALGDRNQ